MAEYYEPNLYMSTPGFPNTMGISVTLTEPVDGDILQEVAEELRGRFPYFYVRAESDGSDLVAKPNPLPMTVRNTWEPIDLRSEEANYPSGRLQVRGQAPRLRDFSRPHRRSRRHAVYEKRAVPVTQPQDRPGIRSRGLQAARQRDSGVRGRRPVRRARHRRG